LIFFALAVISAINCDPTTFASAPYCTTMDVDAYLSRFEPVRAFLGPKLMELGYATDQQETRYVEHGSTTETTKDVDLGAFRRFFMAEYAVAPIVLLDEVNHLVILGNFSSQKAGLQYAEKNDLTVQKDFGNGVFLLQRKAAKS
jgi:hypothetical protein